MLGTADIPSIYRKRHIVIWIVTTIMSEYNSIVFNFKTPHIPKHMPYCFSCWIFPYVSKTPRCTQITSPYALCGLRRSRLVLVHVSCCGAILCLLSRQLCCSRSFANISVRTKPNSVARFQTNFSAVLPSATLFRDVVRVTAASALRVAVRNIFLV